MKKGANFNHPRKGARIKVEPIKTLKDLATIKRLLKDRPRDLAFFVIGINTNLRASDLLAIRAGNVRGLKAMGEIELKEKKTGKLRRISLNGACIDAIKGLLASAPYTDQDFFFRSQRGEVLTVSSASRLVKGWCRTVNLKGNFGSHTLRKTWGYHQRVTFGRSLPELMICLNHSTQRQTLDYLCIQPEEIRSVYENQL
ncbi:MAG: tyrosine-type recombinase/integrase [Desulfobacteraceae bacterium]|nr:tyrosine-type recombinase/integrase [Desulfobacterales bacterium]MBL6967544.1 tyrosine-type recombinase/integrase [Desulfobacteraceae bacterium]